jgi:hypothetical protein
MTNVPDDAGDSLEVVFIETKAKLLAQERNFDALDQKSTVLLGLAGIMLSILLGASAGGMHASVRYFWILSEVSLVSTIVLLVLALSVKEWHFPPKPESLQAFIGKPRRHTVSKLSEELAKAYETNRGVLAGKVRRIKAAYWLLVFAACAMTGAFLLRMFIQ